MSTQCRVNDNSQGTREIRYRLFEPLFFELTVWHGAVFHVRKVAGETALLRRRIVSYMVPPLLTRTAVRKTIAQGVERATWEHAVDRGWKRRFAFVNCDRPQCDTYLAN